MPEPTHEQPTPQRRPEQQRPDPSHRERDDEESGRPVQLDPEKDNPRPCPERPNDPHQGGQPAK